MIALAQAYRRRSLEFKLKDRDLDVLSLSLKSRDPERKSISELILRHCKSKKCDPGTGHSRAFSGKHRFFRLQAGVRREEVARRFIWHEGPGNGAFFQRVVSRHFVGNSSTDLPGTTSWATCTRQEPRRCSST